MGKPSGSSAQAPDPSYVSQQQTQSNVNTAVANGYLNRVNQYGPDGSKTYAVNGTQNVGGVDVSSAAGREPCTAADQFSIRTSSRGRRSESEIP